MDKKDIKSLMEAYDGIALPDQPVVEVTPQNSQEVDVDCAELKDIGQDFQKMTKNNLQSLRSHAYEILSVLENGVMVEAWMNEKIALASDYIVTVANAIMYRK